MTDESALELAGQGNDHDHDHEPTFDRIELGEVDRVAISRVIREANLEAVRVRYLNAEYSLIQAPVGWTSRAFFRWTSHLALRDGGRFSSHAQFMVRFVEDVEPGEGVPFPDYDEDDPPGIDLIAAFELEYSLDDPDAVSDQDLEHFCVLNGSANAWPYWRELAQATTTRMGIEPFVAPLLPIPAISLGGEQ